MKLLKELWMTVTQAQGNFCLRKNIWSKSKLPSKIQSCWTFA